MIYNLLLAINLLFSTVSGDTDLTGKWALTNFYGEESEKSNPLLCKETIEFKKNGTYEISSDCYLTEGFESLEKGSWTYKDGSLQLAERKFSGENFPFYNEEAILKLDAKVEAGTMTFAIKNTNYIYKKQ